MFDCAKKVLLESGVRFAEHEPLASHSSFRIGGSAALAIFPETEEEFLFAFGVLEGENPLVVGRGSNLVFPDEGLSRPVIFTEWLRQLAVENNTITVGAGASVAALCKAACEASLSGLEFAYGIPGSVGGGIYMNAGAYGGELGSFVTSVRYYDRREKTVKTILGKNCVFGYRTSFFKENKDSVILSATFDLKEGDREEILAKMQEFLGRRKATQPLEYPSAGSVFKRPEGAYAGKLIEDCGLKGLSVGGACVSEKHAGFIVNKGSATAENVKALVKMIQTTVFEKTGFSLDCEIEFI